MIFQRGRAHQPDKAGPILLVPRVTKTYSGARVACFGDIYFMAGSKPTKASTDDTHLRGMSNLRPGSRLLRETKVLTAQTCGSPGFVDFPLGGELPTARKWVSSPQL